MSLKVAVVGSIAVGKTSVIEKLNLENAIIFQEPIEKWNSVPDYPHSKTNTIPMFDLYYSEPHKYALPFQTVVQSTYASQFAQLPSGPKNNSIIVLERTFAEQFHVFALNCADVGYLDSHQLATLKYTNDVLVGLQPAMGKVDVVLYLETNIDEQMRRIKQRNRKSEDNITQDYLSSLNERYKEWVENGFAGVEYRSVLCRNSTNLSPGQLAEDLKIMIELVKDDSNTV